MSHGGTSSRGIYRGRSWRREEEMRPRLSGHKTIISMMVVHLKTCRLLIWAELALDDDKSMTSSSPEKIMLKYLRATSWSPLLNNNKHYSHCYFISLCDMTGSSLKTWSHVYHKLIFFFSPQEIKMTFQAYPIKHDTLHLVTSCDRPRGDVALPVRHTFFRHGLAELQSGEVKVAHTESKWTDEVWRVGSRPSRYEAFLFFSCMSCAAVPHN